MKISQRNKPWAMAASWVVAVVLIVAFGMFGFPWRSAHADGLLPPGYRANDLVGPNDTGESWCVGPGQRLLVLNPHASGFVTSVVIDQSQWERQINPNIGTAPAPNGC